MSSAWICSAHGEIAPFHVGTHPVTSEALAWAAKTAQVPVWLPWPLPTGWLVTGLAYAGDDRTDEHILETQRRIPGAVGFPGKFTPIVIDEDPVVARKILGRERVNRFAVDNLGHARVRANEHRPPRSLHFAGCWMGPRCSVRHGTICRKEN
jgi:hypothetical protein